MELFDKKYVHFLYDFNLHGKRGFFANDIGTLIRHVENNSSAVKDAPVKFRDSFFPFEDNSGSEWKFFYFDPLYEWKWLYKSGKKIQYRELASVIDVTWRDVDGSHVWDECYEYKMVLEEAEPSNMLTFIQLTEWLARGNGQVMSELRNLVFTSLGYDPKQDDLESPDGWLVRRWGDTEWHKPTMDYCYPNENKEEA